MKKIAMIVAVCMLLAACGNAKMIGGHVYDVYGIANMDENRNPGIRYAISLGSVIFAVILAETIIVPLYVVLFDLWQPVGPKTEAGIIT